MTNSTVASGPVAATPRSDGVPIVINVPSGTSHTEQKDSQLLPSIISGIEGIAWPLALVILGLVYKTPISGVLARLVSLKGVGIELTAEQQIRENLPDADDAIANDQIDGAASPAPALSPIDTIVTSWVAVESAVRTLVQRPVSSSDASGNPRPYYSSTARNVDFLERRGVIPDDVAAIIRDLRGIRNSAVHEPDIPISRDAARIYAINAAGVISQLQQIAASQGLAPPVTTP
jgi:hypothetical protein